MFDLYAYQRLHKVVAYMIDISPGGPASPFELSACCRTDCVFTKVI